MLYILVADRQRARLYETPALFGEAARPRLLLEQVDFPAREAGGRGFVEDLCRSLGRAQREGRLQRLLLAAPPDLLDQLQDGLPPGCRALLAGVLADNLLACAPQDILQRFAQLPPAGEREGRGAGGQRP